MTNIDRDQADERKCGRSLNTTSGRSGSKNEDEKMDKFTKLMKVLGRQALSVKLGWVSGEAEGIVPVVGLIFLVVLGIWLGR